MKLIHKQIDFIEVRVWFGSSSFEEGDECEVKTLKSPPFGTLCNMCKMIWSGSQKCRNDTCSANEFDIFVDVAKARYRRCVTAK